ncbi:MAG: HAD-IIB family hydrolase [Candidatus Pacebacteria bacterium]|nr:HAD-IIB family hydrolase [Candidatus Paceibacterota bacterium]
MVNLLNKLTEKVLVVIISGSSFKNLLNQLDLFLNQENKEIFKNILLMPANGSETYIYKTTNWEISDSETMGNETKSKIIEVLEKLIDSKNFNIPEMEVGTKIEDRGTQISFAALGIDASIEEKKLWDHDQEKRKKIVNFIKPLLPETDIFIAGTTTIDILPKGITKGVMLRKMLSKRTLLDTDLLFIGDALFEGGNDYEVKKEGFNTISTTGPKETAKIIESILEK